ncbi:M23 family metallopeptidase, partial [Solemya velum gill symbiont]
LQHGKKYTTVYAHLSRFKSGLKKGHKVKQGEVIGYVGSTGLATGPHLHYEFRINDKHVDPLSHKLPAADPIKGDKMAQFKKVAAPLLQQLDQLKAPVIAGQP